jgi:hypothetical protein
MCYHKVVRFVCVTTLGLLCGLLHAQPVSAWRVARSEHFEVYSQAGEETARAALIWFEQLRAFLAGHAGVKPQRPAPMRVIGFRSAKDYDAYRLRPGVAAYYVGTESRDYIVVPTLGAGAFGLAAHEYAHAVLHAGGLRLPAWLNEGLAEFFSTVRIGERGSTVGGDLPARSQALRQGRWIPLAQLMSMSSGTPVTSGVFYAQCWTLTDMLLRSPEYGRRFPALVATLATGTPGGRALTAVYGRPLDVIDRDARAWSERRSVPITLPGVTPLAMNAEVSELSAGATGLLMADVLLASGSLERAEQAYRALAGQPATSADATAALGTIAFRRGDAAGARREWGRAIDQGVTDTGLCYRYAVLASAAGLQDDEIRPVLERVVALKPDHDDARFSLALLEKNAGRHEEALEQLRAMRSVAPARAYHYWSAMADALNQLGRREEAKAAARRAGEHAASAEERAHAARLSYIAATEMTVRLARDANGAMTIVTTRVPHDTQDWNPFIEPDDIVRRATGTLAEIDCGAKLTRFLLETPAGPLALAIPDPSKLAVRNGPAEFTCGLQAATLVAVVYAAGEVKEPKADGVLRGIEFR